MSRDVTNPTPDERADLGQDLLGIALFAAATFLAVSVLMLRRSDLAPLEGMQGLVQGLVDTFGAFPLVALGGALAILGARLWLFGLRESLLRHALGILGLGVCLAILAGAFSDQAGGALGEATAGAVRRQFHWSLAALFGLAALLLPAWFAWIKPRAYRAAAEGNRGPQATRTQSLSDSEGLSAAEADALLPPLPVASQLAGPRPAWVGQVQAPSPYPPDVRRQGAIPAGTRPLDPQDGTPRQPRIVSHDAASLRPRPSESQPRADDTSVAHLASAESGSDPFAATFVDPGPGAASERSSFPSVSARGSSLNAPPAAAAVPVVPHDPSGPRAAWETADEEPAIEPEDPAQFVDAYGTPRELVAELRAANEALRQDLEDYAGEDDELGPVRPLEAAALPEARTQMLAQPKPREPELSLAERAHAPPVPHDAAPAPESAGEQANQLEVEDFSDSVEPPGSEPLEQESSNGEFEPAAGQPDLVQRPSDDGPESGLDGELPLDSTGESADSDDAHEVTVLPRSATRPPQRGLFEETITSTREPEPRVHRARSARQRRDAVAAKGSPAAPHPTAIDELVFRAGCLFLERQRVAVSMLQKDFGLDFKQATAVLDQLQEAGLIGPYLGGQRRDILMTLEQWRERSGVLT
jgi:hypothetical protein